MASKYKITYVDCLRLIYSTYKTELSFGVDKEVILSELENYFDRESSSEMVFDEDEEIAKDSRSKANGILRRLKDSGWIEYEMSNDYRVKVNLIDYAATMIESFNKIIKNEEMEYQALVSQIHATILNQDSYVKPYEYIIKRVAENTEELMIGLKKLNTNIKKYIDAITNEKTAGEIVQDFFVYHREIGSKAYHRIKTSENISHFRTAIIENLYNILNDRNLFERAVLGYMEIEMGYEKNSIAYSSDKLNQSQSNVIEQVKSQEQIYSPAPQKLQPQAMPKTEINPDKVEAENALRNVIHSIISAFKNYDEIISEIDGKNSKYIASAIARAKFLLTNTNNAEGKIATILKTLSKEFNQDERLNLYDEIDDDLFEVFQIFPQGFIDSDSLYVVPISKKMSLPQELDLTLGISKQDRELRKALEQERARNRFSRKNINQYVEELFSISAKQKGDINLDSESKMNILASTIAIGSKRDFIRIIFISLYGRDKKSKYKTTMTDQVHSINGFRFRDFNIERCD